MIEHGMKNFFSKQDLCELLEDNSVVKYSDELYEALKNSSHIVYMYDAKLVGVIRSMDDGYEIANIDFLAVNKEYRGRGISMVLLKELLYDLRQIKNINICVCIKDDERLEKMMQGFCFKRLDNHFYLERQK